MEGLRSTLRQHIAPSGIVACWMTNNSTARTAVMEAFKAWDIGLVEEWCWLKVTRDGQPVTGIRGVWRKPYEVLLIGRKQTNHKDDYPSPQEDLKRKVIVAVPDIHSRKPCIKQQIEEAFRFEEGKYRALEVFARNLTAGWWAWGDECLRFQWDGWWEDDYKDEEDRGKDEGEM